MVTAELAAALPVLVVVIAIALAALTGAGQRVRALDAAREVARAAARGDPAAAQRLARATAPGASVEVSRSGRDVVARVRLVVRPLGGWLPAMHIDESAVAAAEPDSDGPAAGAPP